MTERFKLILDDLYGSKAHATVGYKSLARGLKNIGFQPAHVPGSSSDTLPFAHARGAREVKVEIPHKTLMHVAEHREVLEEAIDSSKTLLWSGLGLAGRWNIKQAVSEYRHEQTKNLSG